MQTKNRRGGVPQYTQPHVLLAGGAEALEGLFPGLKDRLLRHGALAYDAAQGILVYDYGGQYPRDAETSVEIINVSRRLLNATLQEMLLNQAGERVVIRDKTKVANLLFDEKAQRKGWKARKSVTGVILESGERVYSDLVVMSTGRKSQLRSWLEEAGVALKPPIKVDSKITYASCWMKPPSDYNPKTSFYSAVVNGRPQSNRGGIAIAIENNLVQVTMAGFMGERAPLDLEGWLNYARSLPDLSIYNLVSRSELLTPIVRFTGVPNVCHRYHQVKCLPYGLIIVGDAGQALNPVYGQGMTIAALDGRLLQKQISKLMVRKRSPDAFRNSLRLCAPKLHKKLHKQASQGWLMATSEDMRYDGVIIEGTSKPPRILYKYTDALLLAAQNDKKVWGTFIRVAQFVDPPSKMFSPRMIRAAFWGKKTKQPSLKHGSAHTMDGKNDSKNIQDADETRIPESQMAPLKAIS